MRRDVDVHGMRTNATVTHDSERRPYEVQVHQTTLQPGIDPAGFNRLADEVEDEAVVEKATTDSAG